MLIIVSSSLKIWVKNIDNTRDCTKEHLRGERIQRTWGNDKFFFRETRTRETLKKMENYTLNRSMGKTLPMISSGVMKDTVQWLVKTLTIRWCLREATTLWQEVLAKLYTWKNNMYWIVYNLPTIRLTILNRNGGIFYRYERKNVFRNRWEVLQLIAVWWTTKIIQGWNVELN